MMRGNARGGSFQSRGTRGGQHNFRGGRGRGAGFAAPQRSFVNQRKQLDQEDDEMKQDTDLGPSIDGEESVDKAIEKPRGHLSAGRTWRLIIRNLPFTATIDELKTVLTEFGAVDDLVLPKCKDPRYPNSCAGYGFVQFAKKPDAVTAQAELKSFKGRDIAIDWAIAKDTYETRKHDERAELEASVKKEKSEGADAENKTQPDVDVKMETDGEDDDSVDDEEEEEEDGSSKNDDDDKMDDEEQSDVDSPPKKKRKDDEKTEKKKKRWRDEEDPAVLEGRVVFIRDLSFDSTEDALREKLAEFGTVKLAVVCRFSDSGRSKGTAFAHFSTKEEAEACCQAARSASLQLDGRTLRADPAIPRSDAARIQHEKTEKTPKDKRNLYLLRIALIREGTEAAKGMSSEDSTLRMRLAAAAKKKLANLHMFVSPTRLVIHNVPFSWSDAKLKSSSAPSDAELLECRIWRDRTRFDEQGHAKSKGFAFVAFSTHSAALGCLQKMNNNPKIFSESRRPVVEFSIENLAALKLKEKRVAKNAKNANATPLKRGKTATRPGSSLVDSARLDRELGATKRRVAATGARASLPKRLGAKIRTAARKANPSRQARLEKRRDKRKTEKKGGDGKKGNPEHAKQGKKKKRRQPTVAQILTNT